MSAEQKQSESAKLLRRLDADEDGVMTFKEFAAWFEKTAESIGRFKRGHAGKSRVQSSSQQPQNALEAALTPKEEKAAPSGGWFAGKEAQANSSAAPDDVSHDEEMEMNKALVRAKKKFDQVDARLVG